MDIYILRDGKEIGPFSEETTQTLLRQGSIREVDFAWRPGLPKWIPLTDVLKPALNALETPPPPPPSATAAAIPPLVSAPAGDLPKALAPATEKQKALLNYLAVSFSAGITKDKAALLVNDVMEDPKNTARLAQWNADRLKLHPDLFAVEIRTKKEGRVNEFFGHCETEGAEYFTKITKAHCKVVVGYLDEKFPDWDDDREAARNYFFPAAAEKFPQLVAKQWKGKLHYATKPKATTEPAAQRFARSKRRKQFSLQALPLQTIGRGLVFAVILVAMVWFVSELLKPGARPTTSKDKPPGDQTASPAPKADAAQPLPEIPADAQGAGPEKAIAKPDPEVPAPALALPGEAPVADPTIPGGVDPKIPPAPGDPKMAATPEMVADPLAPKPATPPDPLAPANPTPAPVPAPAEPASTTPPAGIIDANAPVKTNLKLTKPFDVQLAYGKMKLPVGTPVKFVSREGNSIRVNYLNTVMVVPITSTDFADPAPAPTPVHPPAPAPAAPKGDL